MTGQQADQDFKARSADRDAETDRSREGCILAANRKCTSCGRARAVRPQRAGWGRPGARCGDAWKWHRRIYLERDARDSHHQDLFSAEISNGQRRLKELATAIPHFKF
jgi:hypothetical protein